MLSDAWGRGAAGRAAALLLLAFFVGSNLLHTARVLAQGRNDYLETLAYIDRHTTGPSLEIGSDHDFRNPTLIRFKSKGFITFTIVRVAKIELPVCLFAPISGSFTLAELRQ